MNKIAIDTSTLKSGHKVRGIGVNTRELIDGLGKLKDKSINIYPIDFSGAELSTYDLIHYQYFNPYFFSLPVKKIGRKVLLTVHDLIYLVYPKAYPPGLKGRIRFQIQKLLMRNTDGILTISETSKKDIVRFLGVKANKIYVVHLAPRSIFKTIESSKVLNLVRNKYKLPPNFVLYVGDVNYNKNIVTLIKACREEKLTLVIIGKQAMSIEGVGMGLSNIHGPRDWVRYITNKPHPELAHFQELKDEFKKSSDIIRLGFVPDSDLVAIYNLATLYCQPSFYEGFGLPVLEAMACGTPVAASKIQAHKEIAGDAVEYFDPESTQDMSSVIKRVGFDKKIRSDLIIKSKKNIEKYSWERTTEGVLKVYKSMLIK